MVILILTKEQMYYNESKSFSTIGVWTTDIMNIHNIKSLICHPLQKYIKVYHKPEYKIKIAKPLENNIKEFKWL